MVGRRFPSTDTEVTVPAERKGKMICNECGVEMNHHADKLLDPRNAAEARLVDPHLEGILEKTHTCPECGRADSTRGG